MARPFVVPLRILAEVPVSVRFAALFTILAPVNPNVPPTV